MGVPARTRLNPERPIGGFKAIRRASLARKNSTGCHPVEFFLRQRCAPDGLEPAHVSPMCHLCVTCAPSMYVSSICHLCVIFMSSMCHLCVIYVSSMCHLPTILMNLLNKSCLLSSSGQDLSNRFSRLFHLCVIYVSSLCHLCVICVSSMCHLCGIYVSSMCHLCVTYVLSMCHPFVIYVSFLCHLCVIYVSSTHDIDEPIKQIVSVELQWAGFV